MGLQGCLGPLTGTGVRGQGGLLACRKCALMKSRCCQGKELQEEIGRLHRVRDDEKEVHWIISKTLKIQEPENPTGRGKGRICAYLDRK